MPRPLYVCSNSYMLSQKKGYNNSNPTPLSPMAIILAQNKLLPPNTIPIQNSNFIFTPPPLRLQSSPYSSNMNQSLNLFMYISNLIIMYLNYFVFIFTDFYLGILFYHQIASKIKNG